MIKVVVISAQSDLEFWQKQFSKSNSGPIEVKLHTQVPTAMKCDLVVLDFSGQPSGKELLLQLAPQVSGKPLVIASDQKDVDLAIEAVKLSATAFLVKPFLDVEFKPILNKLEVIAKQKEEEEKASGKVLTMLSYKGGTGVSTATVNLAYAVSGCFNKKTLLIDAAGFSNHLTVLLNVPPKCTIVDICQQGEEIDENYLNSAVKMVNENLGVIGGMIKTEDLGLINIKAINKLIQVAKGVYEYIIVDTATHAVDELTLTFLQNSYQLLMLTTFDLLTVKDNRFYIQALKEIGIEESKIKPVINRQDWFIGSLEPELVQKQLNHPIYHALPNDWNLCVESANYGRPVMDFAPESPLALSYKSLAAKIIGVDITGGVNQNRAEQPNASNKGLFGMFQKTDLDKK